MGSIPNIYGHSQKAIATHRGPRRRLSNVDADERSKVSMDVCSGAPHGVGPLDAFQWRARRSLECLRVKSRSPPGQKVPTGPCKALHAGRLGSQQYMLRPVSKDANSTAVWIRRAPSRVTEGSSEKVLRKNVRLSYLSARLTFAGSLAIVPPAPSVIPVTTQEPKHDSQACTENLITIMTGS